MASGGGRAEPAALGVESVGQERRPGPLGGAEATAFGRTKLLPVESGTPEAQACRKVKSFGKVQNGWNPQRGRISSAGCSVLRILSISGEKWTPVGVSGIYPR